MEKLKLEQKKGITLVALVVTIVVLLILVGITITVLFGENGVVAKAQEAKDKTEDSTAQEMIALATIEAQKEAVLNGSITIDEYLTILEQNGLISDTKINGNNIKDKGNDDEGNSIYEITTDDGYVFKAIINESVKTEYIGKSGEITEEETPAVTGIALNSVTVNLTLGSTCTITATVEPEGANVTWSSSNPDIATVEGISGTTSAVITGITSGATTVTVEGSGVIASCTVNVSEPRIVAPPVSSDSNEELDEPL